MERDDLKELDYGLSMSVQTLVRAMGMQAENQQRIHRGESIAYPEEAFSKLIEDNGIHHNAILTRWYRP